MFNCWICTYGKIWYSVIFSASLHTAVINYFVLKHTVPQFKIEFRRKICTFIRNEANWGSLEFYQIALTWREQNI